MKKSKNEQTNSSSIFDITIPSTSNSIYHNQLESMENILDKKSYSKGHKIKAYHPKMMIAYKSKLIASRH